MKLLVFSHACVEPTNQSFYAEVEAATGWNVSLVVPDSWSNEYSDALMPQRLGVFSGPLHLVPVWNRGNIPLHLYKRWLGGLLRRLRPDAIYVHHEPYGMATAQVYLANRLTGNAVIGFYAAQNIYKRYPWPIATIERWILSHSDFCFPVTEGALAVIRDKGYEGRATVLPLAVDSNMYLPRDKAAATLRQLLGIAPDLFVIGFLGRLVKEKGLITLVRALTKMRQFPWVCVVAGAGAIELELRTEIQRCGLAERVLLTGYVPHHDGPHWLSMYDVLVLPSESSFNWKEQFGRVLIEANACGTAVIGSECGEIPAVIGRTGGGVVVPEADPGRLAQALIELLQNQEKRQSLADHGQSVVVSEYDQSHLAAQFASQIEESIRRRAS